MSSIVKRVVHVLKMEDKRWKTCKIKQGEKMKKNGFLGKLNIWGM